MFTRPNVTKLETRDIFKTETRPRRSIFPNSGDRDETDAFRKTSRDRLDRDVQDRDYTGLTFQYL